jgi:hypothetical protein
VTADGGDLTDAARVDELEIVEAIELGTLTDTPPVPRVKKLWHPEERSVNFLK